MPESNGMPTPLFPEEDATKRCGRCKEVKPFRDFGKIHGKARSHCRVCHKEGNNNPDLRTEKPCSHCKQIKPMTEFNRQGRRFCGYCRPCQHEAVRACHERQKASGRAKVIYRAYYVEKRRWVKMLHRHGLTQEQYEAMWHAQGGVCDICKKEETDQYRGTVLELSVDHNHATGDVRGLLCRACNLAIGKLGDDPKIIQAAVDYLLRHQR